NENTAMNLIYNGGLQIYACIDMKAQQIVDNIYMNAANFPQSKAPNGESLQSAIVIMDPYNGKIVAMSGGIGEKTGNLVFNRAVDAQRPPGSSIKPIAVYGPAIDQGLISPADKVLDGKVELSGIKNWFPQNAGGGYGGRVVTIRQALISSLNTVSAQILDKLTPGVSYQYLHDRLGVVSLVEEDRNYAPLALGQLTNGITVREMAQAFSAFPNDGVFTYGRSYTHILDSEGKMVLDNTPDTIVAFKANTAWTISDMLNDAATYGTGSESNLGIMPHAGKTGSSTDYQDRWFVGYTPYYVAAVWTGYDTPARMYVSGNPAAQIWRKVMYSLHEGLPYKTFKEPTYIKPTNIFGDIEEEESPSPSPSEEVPEESGNSSSPPVSDPGTGTDIPTPTPPTPSLPVTPTPAPTPTTAPSPTPTAAQPAA
ncbi:MAG: hypothetical protein GX025_10425, partial [Clostridiales bacterium]|nr:hypothetical protein [Clostridiales bacterium]